MLWRSSEKGTNSIQRALPLWPNHLAKLRPNTAMLVFGASVRNSEGAQVVSPSSRSLLEVLCHLSFSHPIRTKLSGAWSVLSTMEVPVPSSLENTARTHVHLKIQLGEVPSRLILVLRFTLNHV